MSVFFEIASIELSLVPDCFNNQQSTMSTLLTIMSALPTTMSTLPTTMSTLPTTMSTLRTMSALPTMSIVSFEIF